MFFDCALLLCPSMKRNALILALFLILSPVASPLARAQSSGPSPTPSPNPDDALYHAYARDTVDHDPDHAPKYSLDHEVKQDKFAKQQFIDLVTKFPVGTIKEIAHLFHELATHSHKVYNHVLNRSPELFDLFKIHEERYLPTAENGLALVNADFDFDHISDRSRGFCWGFATMNRQFAILAFFDPTAPKLDLEGNKELMDQLTDGKPVIIPGFRNIREFSLVPEHVFYLKLKAMSLWRKYAIRGKAGLAYFKTAKVMEMDEIQDLLSDLKDRLARHEFPKIMISSMIQTPGRIHFSKYVHLVLVNRVETHEDGSAIIHIWDGNFFAETQQKDPKVIEITKDGDIIYQPWIEPHTPTEAISNKLSRIMYSVENDNETIQQLMALKKFCASNPNLCGVTASKQ